MYMCMHACTSNLESNIPSTVLCGPLQFSLFQLGSRESLSGPGQSLQTSTSVDQCELLLTWLHAAEVWAHVHWKTKNYHYSDVKK